MTSKAFEMVVAFRNQAIAVLRLQKVNGLTQDLQEANSSLKGLQSDLDGLNKRIADVSSGEFMPSLSDVNRYGSADEAKAAVLKGLNDSVVSLTKTEAENAAHVAEIEAKIAEAAKGKRPYKFSRDTITEMTNELIRQSGNTLDLSAVEVVGEGSGTEEFDQALKS